MIGIIETGSPHLASMLADTLHTATYQTRIFTPIDNLKPDHFYNIDLVIIPFPDLNNPKIERLIKEIGQSGTKVIILTIWEKEVRLRGQAGIEFILVPTAMSFILERVRTLLSSKAGVARLG